MDSIDHPTETRALGWYALRWNHITEWYRQQNKRLHVPSLNRHKPAQGGANSSSTSQPVSLPQLVDTPWLHRNSRRDPKHVKEKVLDELKEAVDTSEEVLYSTKTVFPFTLVPDSVSIDRTNLVIAHRDFFRIASIITIKIQDILNITPNLGPFFASLRVVVNFVDEESPYTVDFLKRGDALRISRLVKGFKIAIEKEIDVSALPNKQLLELFDKLARDGTEV